MTEMLKHYGGGAVPATSVRTYSILEVVRLFLLNHGCHIETINKNEEVVSYPPGTTREELYPRTSDIRYRVMLPDGIELREIDRRGIDSRCLMQIVLDSHSTPELEMYAEHDKKVQDQLTRITRITPPSTKTEY